MASTIRIYQGSGKNITWNHKETGLTSADEIEFLIDSEPQVKKTKTGGGIVGISATSFTVVLDGDDTRTLKAPDEVCVEVRYTTGTTITHGRLNPSRVQIIDSAFVP